jgi:hypothetical protein
MGYNDGTEYPEASTGVIVGSVAVKKVISAIDAPYKCAGLIISGGAFANTVTVADHDSTGTYFTFVIAANKDYVIMPATFPNGLSIWGSVVVYITHFKPKM